MAADVAKHTLDNPPPPPDPQLICPKPGIVSGVIIEEICHLKLLWEMMISLPGSLSNGKLLFLSATLGLLRCLSFHAELKCPWGRFKVLTAKCL